MLAHRASYDKKTLAQQVIPLAPGYRTALSSRPGISIRVCAYTYTRMCIYLYAYVRISIRVCAYKNAYISTYAYTRLFICMYELAYCLSIVSGLLF